MKLYILQEFIAGMLRSLDINPVIPPILQNYHNMAFEIRNV